MKEKDGSACELRSWGFEVCALCFVLGALIGGWAWLGGKDIYSKSRFILSFVLFRVVSRIILAIQGVIRSLRSRFRIRQLNRGHGSSRKSSLTLLACKFKLSPNLACNSTLSSLRLLVNLARPSTSVVVKLLSYPICRQKEL